MRKPRLYIKVTHDEYELPIAVARSTDELAKITGDNPNSIKSQISKFEHGKLAFSPFRRVILDDDVSDMEFINEAGVATLEALTRLRQAIDPEKAKYPNGKRKELWGYDEILKIIDGKGDGSE